MKSFVFAVNVPTPNVLRISPSDCMDAQKVLMRSDFSLTSFGGLLFKEKSERL